MRTVLVLILLVLAAIFASQNAGMVTVAFLWWHAEASLAVVITVCLASGCAISSPVTTKTMNMLKTEAAAMKAQPLAL